MAWRGAAPSCLRSSELILWRRLQCLGVGATDLLRVGSLAVEDNFRLLEVSAGI